MVKQQFSGSASLITSKNLASSKRKKQMMGLALKVDIVVFVCCLITLSYVTLCNPEWFSGPMPKDGLTGQNCSLVLSYYHNPLIAKALCIDQGKSTLLFSKPGTFIFLAILLAFIFRSAITIHRPFSKSNIIFHFALIACILLLVYLLPEMMHVSLEVLSPKEIGICFGCALGAVCMGLVSRGGILMTNSGRIFHFEIKIGEGSNQYSDLLKEHKICQTLNFPLVK